MKKSVWIACGMGLSAMFLAAANLPVAAEGGSGQFPLLTLNVKKVFADYKKFQQLSESLKGQLDAREKQLAEMEQTIKAKHDSIATLTKQEDRDNIQREIQDLKFEYEKTRRDARNEFLAKEADMYAVVYDEMHKLVQNYCTQHNYYLVLRAEDPEPQDKSTPNRILQTLNREVVYGHPNLDMTQVIVSGLNEQFAQAQAKAPGAGAIR